MAQRAGPVVDRVLAGHAVVYWQRPLRRLEGERGVEWRIDGERVAVLEIADRGPATLVVHDFSAFDPLRRACRTRHVRVRLATPSDG